MYPLYSSDTPWITYENPPKKRGNYLFIEYLVDWVFSGLSIQWSGN